MLVICQPQDTGAHHWPLFDFERPPRLFGGTALRFGLTFAFRQVAEINSLDFEVRLRSDEQYGAPANHFVSCPQHFMAAHDLRQAFVQRGAVELASDTQNLGML